jgi:hypothetical protein
MGDRRGRHEQHNENGDEQSAHASKLPAVGAR